MKKKSLFLIIVTIILYLLQRDVLFGRTNDTFSIGTTIHFFHSHYYTAVSQKSDSILADLQPPDRSCTELNLHISFP
ncbi:MAG: hypothetical protein KDC49_04675 [Saprospiraceae bacterium]|nr:hypothetical protein [Saprospiraceae bacterium]